MALMEEIIDSIKILPGLPVTNVLRKEVIFRCLLCNADFTYRNIILHHVKTKHLKGAKLKHCSLCNIEYHSRRNWDLHIITFHCNIREELVNQLTLVEYNLALQKDGSFGQMKGMTIRDTKHSETETESTKLASCDESQRAEAPYTDINDLVEKEQEKEVLDNNSDAKLQTGQRMTIEDKSSNPLPKAASRKKGVQLEKASGNKLMKNSFPVIDVKTMHETSLKKHQTVNSKNNDGEKVRKAQRVQKCPHCDYSTNYYNMNRHLRDKHSIGLFKYVKCEKCGYTTTEKWMLNRHLTTVHNIFTIKCVKCKESFKTYAELKCHRMENIKGDSCNKKLKVNFEGTKKKSASSNAAVEQRSNSIKNLKKCKFCDKKFVRQSFLTRHLKFVHSFTDDFKGGEAFANGSEELQTSSG